MGISWSNFRLLMLSRIKNPNFNFCEIIWSTKSILKKWNPKIQMLLLSEEEYHIAWTFSKERRMKRKGNRELASATEVSCEVKVSKPAAEQIKTAWQNNLEKQLFQQNSRRKADCINWD